MTPTLRAYSNSITRKNKTSYRPVWCRFCGGTGWRPIPRAANFAVTRCECRLGIQTSTDLKSIAARGSPMTLRQTVSNLMVAAHRISPELAAGHVARMSDSEVRTRFRFYTHTRTSGTELSAVGPNKQSRATPFPPGFVRPGDDDGRPAALNPVSADPETRLVMPDSEVSKPGPIGAADFAAPGRFEVFT